MTYLKFQDCASCSVLPAGCERCGPCSHNARAIGSLLRRLKDPAFRIVGDLCVYFNKHADAPLVWSICPSPRGARGAWPRWELEVCHVEFCGVVVQTVYAPREKPDDETGLPSAYLAVYGELAVRDGTGIAVITNPSAAE